MFITWLKCCFFSSSSPSSSSSQHVWWPINNVFCPFSFNFFSLFIFFRTSQILSCSCFFLYGPLSFGTSKYEWWWLVDDGGGGGGTISSSMCFVYVFVFVNSDELFFWLEKIFILNTSQSLVAFCYWNLLQFIPSSPSPFPSFFFFQNNKSSSSSHQVKKISEFFEIKIELIYTSTGRWTVFFSQISVTIRWMNEWN